MNKQVQPQNPFQPVIKVHDFEGPLDLLLHLIKQSEMDIYDIQISQITSQYLDYLHQMQSHQLEVAGEYFVMAATLMDIKSQMLLPSPPVLDDELEVEELDPRQELVEQLLEYQRYKKAADRLKDKENLRQQEYTRPAMQVPREMVKSHVEPGIKLTDLQQASQNRITLMAGCGVNETNITHIARETGIREFHFSARESIDSAMRYRNGQISMGGTVKIGEYVRSVTTETRVRRTIQVLQSATE